MPDDPKDTDAPAPKADDGKTFTQADVDRVVADRLAREKAKHADYEDLKAKAAKFDDLDAATKSDIEKANDKAATAEARAAKAESDALRLQIAFDKGLTPTQAKRLAGGTKEELEADADELLEAFPAGDGPKSTPGKPTTDLKGGGDPTEEPDVDVRQVINAIPRGV